MSKAMKVWIGVLSVLLIAAIVWIVWLATGDGETEATPQPEPGVTETVEGSPSPEPETPSPAPEPPQTTEPATPTGTPTPPEAPDPDEQSFLGEGLASFENFSVEVFPYDPDAAPEPIDGKVGFEVEICVLQTVGEGEQTRVSTEPWRMEGSSGELRRPVEGVYDPVFPPEGDYAVGDCVSGWITFDEFDAEALEWAILIYENGLGDRAVWNFH